MSRFYILADFRRSKTAILTIFDSGRARLQKLRGQGGQNAPKNWNFCVLLHFYVTISESWGGNCPPCPPGCAATDFWGIDFWKNSIFEMSKILRNVISMFENVKNAIFAILRGFVFLICFNFNLQKMQKKKSKSRPLNVLKWHFLDI